MDPKDTNAREEEAEAPPLPDATEQPPAAPMVATVPTASLALPPAGTQAAFKPPSPCPACSADIKTLAEARLYYRTKLAGFRDIDRHGELVKMYFDKDATHLFSEKPKNGPPEQHNRVTRLLPGGKREEREFCLERAVLMDHVLPSVAKFDGCVAGNGWEEHEVCLVFGPAPFLCVAIRSGPRGSWQVSSAYPVAADKRARILKGRRTKFPPKKRPPGTP